MFNICAKFPAIEMFCLLRDMIQLEYGIDCESDTQEANVPGPVVKSTPEACVPGHVSRRGLCPMKKACLTSHIGVPGPMCYFLHPVLDAGVYYVINACLVCDIDI